MAVIVAALIGIVASSSIGIAVMFDITGFTRVDVIQIVLLLL